LKLFSKAHIATAILLLGIVLTYASVFVTPSLSNTSLENPPDSIKGADLPAPLPKETNNPFENKQNQDNGMRLKESDDVRYEVTYNEETNEYEAQKMVGDKPAGPPFAMSATEYFKFSGKERQDNYWQTRSAGSRRGDDSAYEPNLELGTENGESFFEDNNVDIKPQGAAELTFGFKHTNNRNPRFTKKQQRKTQFDFDTKIQMSVTGSIGDKMSLVVKYDTEAQFEFEREVKLEYEGKEDEIIKKIEIGNVSFPLTNSLISGSQSLFGFKTELQFGKLYVTGVFSKQQGEFSSINVEGGAQSEEFEVRCDEYQKNKHYFLGHHFRGKYEDAFKNIPEVSTGIIIRKVEVWVTQTSSGKEDSRNILALTDLGDSYENSPYGKEYDLPQNGKLYNSIKNISGIRDINNISTALQGTLTQGRDYEKVEQAVLLKPNEYEINTTLGYISLRTSVSPSKILAVAYEYEYKGQVYQVGEFSSDGIEHPGVLLVKMLKSSQANPSYNNWDLMMKNVYSIGGYQISKEDFILNVLYEDDRTGTPIPYIPDGDIKGKNLLSVLNLDTLTTDDLPYADGIFDFVDGYTINASKGLIYFPVLEPFGSYLEKAINDDDIAQNYVYNQLYDSTQSAARQVTEKNKFILQGEYKSSVRSEISLNTSQVQEGSVKVTAGGRPLVEGSDFTVDYMGGSVKIINEGLLQSGSNIKVTFESNPLFNMKTKTLAGTRFDYRYNPNINFGATLMRLSEQPMVHKVGFDDYPIKNTMWGLDATYSTESTVLTSLVDKYVPFVETKEVSSIQLSGEFAQIIPGQSKYISDAVELDNFENTEGRLYLREPTSWKIASVPQGQKSLFPEGQLVNNVAAGFNRAHISWFDINTSFYTRSSDVSKEIQQSAFSHAVQETYLFPQRDVQAFQAMPLSILNIAYYPYERGQYNYDTKGEPGISSGLESNGRLKDPKSRWAGLMLPLSTTDFEESNIEYLEFWLMDPFVTDTSELHDGGDLYINLGRISEDVLRDGRKSAENGLIEDKSRYDETNWGRVPNYQIVETGFNNDIEREIQDVGIDGLSDRDERSFFATYLNEVSEIVTDPEVFETFKVDPSADNFSSYNNNRGVEVDLIWRYKYFSGTDNNSPTESVEGTSSYKPDVEDINSDNTLQETEAYYQYKISLRPEDMVIGKNFIVDNVVEQIDNKDIATWYQFKIPINSEEKERIGDISDFRDIPYMRMFMKDFQDSIVLRIAEFSLVYSSWRRYNQPIYESGEYDIFNDSEFDISVVNIEENSQRYPVNYVLPPNVSRVTDPMNTQISKLNESSLALKVVDLDDGNSKAVYKQFNRDLRQFGKLEMFVHAEELVGEEGMLDEGDLSAFIRIGSDFTNNYYEYEIPLSYTAHLQSTTDDQVKDTNKQIEYNNALEADRYMVWPEDNMLSLDLNVLKELKLERDRMILDGEIPDLQTYHVYSIPHGKNIVRIKGKPSISNVRTVMIGVRNPKRSKTNERDDALSKSGIIWFDELRLTDINDQSGWAAIASARINLADFATVSLAGKTSKAGFGSIDQKVFERSQEDLFQYDVASNVALHKFFPEEWGVSLPFYADLSEVFITPQYDPSNPDILLSESLDNMELASDRDSLLFITQDYTRRSSYNFTNVRIVRPESKPSPYNIGNFSTSYAYSEIFMRDIDYVKNYNHQYKAAFNYAYNMRPKNYKPFEKNKIRLIKDINFYLLPSTISVKNDWLRTYKEQQRRNLSASVELPVLASKTFDWNRSYVLKYNLAKNMKFSYSALNQSRINEPYGVIEKSDEQLWQEYKQEVWGNLQTFGENTEFSQKWDFSYKLPIDKIKLFDWITSNYKYTGSYDWQIGSQSFSDVDFGNNIKNSNSQSIDASLNCNKLYQKSTYLKSVQKRMRSSSRSNNRKETVKYNQEGVSLTEGKVIVINHKLKTNDVRVTVITDKGQLVQGKTEIVSDKKVEFTPTKTVDNAKIIVVGKLDVSQTKLSKVTDNVVNTLMMTKTVSLNYSQSEGTYIPGYKYGTNYLGLNDPFNNGMGQPGYGYVFGGISGDLDDYLNTDNWIVDNELISEKFKKTYTNQLRVQASLRPVNNMRITINSDRRFSKNTMRYLIGDEDINKANSQIDGNYSMSFNTMATAFNADKAYETFKENRLIIAHRLAKENFGETYLLDPLTGFPKLIDETSQDVLIPAFTSAYSGQNPNNVFMDNYFMAMFSSTKDFLRTLNWRFSYNGLARLESFKKHFKSLTLNHAYSSNYNMGGYESFSSENTFEEFFIDPSDGELYLAPKYDVQSVSITERFNPIIGVNAKMNNNFTAKFEVRNNRTVTMSFTNTEISENGGFEFVVGGGYVFENFKLKLNSKTYENDLNVRIDFSARDNQTIRRNIVEDITRKISGSKMYSLKSYADYMLNERFTLRLFLDYNMNQPLTNGYKTSSWNGGLNLRFSLI